jgi:hypothetical protein
MPLCFGEIQLMLNIGFAISACSIRGREKWLFFSMSIKNQSSLLCYMQGDKEKKAFL